MQTRQPAALEGPSKAGQLSPGASLDTTCCSSASPSLLASPPSNLEGRLVRGEEEAPQDNTTTFSLAAFPELMG